MYFAQIVLAYSLKTKIMHVCFKETLRGISKELILKAECFSLVTWKQEVKKDKQKTINIHSVESMTTLNVS